ncbi:MAG TPA: hypothetical protein VKD72_15215, partial [Gemmataceae bacterium]|nr:hypothetical protein [Gemmataceae bacterium]
MQSWRAVNVVTISQGITAATRSLAIFHPRPSPRGRVRQTGRDTYGYAQGFYRVTPQGKLLECDNTLSAERTKRRLASALKKFDPTDEVPRIEEGRKDPRFTEDPPQGDRAGHSHPNDGEYPSMTCTRRLRCGMTVVFLLLGSAVAGAEEPPGERFLDITRGGKPSATLVAPDDKSPVWDDAIAMITSTAKRWGGSPKVVRLGKEDRLPAGDLILLGTVDTSDIIAQRSRLTESPISRVPFADPHGFAVEARTEAGSKRLLIAGKTPRGAYNGAVFCRDFLLDAASGEKADVFVRSTDVVRSPRLGARGTYHLSLYGVAMKYTAEDWMKVIDRYAEDGMERVYFWLSGHHPSKKYPHLYNVDSTRGTKLTVDGVRRLIRYCHDRGIKFYIGGGVFAWTASHYLIQGHPEIAAVKASGLCPSRPYARTGNREHFLEMYDTWPEADGFMFEIRDEHGECQCPDCRKVLDAFGSKAYGKAEITWLQEFAREAWKKNPRLHFCWLIGYAEHKNDVYYYDQIRRMSDPRFEWLDTRVGLDLKGPWRLPGPGGRPHPLAFFSRRISHWDPFYKMSVDAVLTAARRSADEGLAGYVPAFEPGFGTGSYYFDQVPLPMNILPYCLTGFVYREATWDPSLTLDELKQRIH